MALLSGQNIGTNYKGILNLGSTINTALSGTLQAITDGDGNASPLQLSTGEVGISRTIALSAGATNVRLINETYTINNSGAQSGTLTGIFLNATETALNGMTHNLMDLQVGGSSVFRVGRTGTLNAASGNFVVDGGYVQAASGWKFNWSGRARISSTSSTNILLENSSENGFGLLQLGGQTVSFPAIKRNGAAIDFVLANDSAGCRITASRLDLSGALLCGFINDTSNAITAITIANTTGKTTFSAPLRATALPTSQPATTGDLYVDTAANILANGDLVVGIKV